MAKPDKESRRKDIIKKLQEAGPKGLTKKALEVSSKLKNEAFQELEKERIIANLGNKKNSLYVLKEYFTPLEMACDLIEKKIASDKPEILSRSKIKKLAKIPAEVKKKMDDALAWLIKENKVMKVWQGKNIFFIYVPAILSSLPGKKPISEKKQNELNRQKVVEAYRSISSRIGFSNIEISELQKELDVPMDILNDFILEQCRQGKAVLSRGDWSLTSEEIHSAAVYLEGSPYLLIRFEE